MKKIALNSIIALTAVMAFAIPQSAHAQRGAAALEGAWDSFVTLTNCQGGTLAEFRAYVMFNGGGTLNSTRQHTTYPARSWIRDLGAPGRP